MSRTTTFFSSHNVSIHIRSTLMQRVSLHKFERYPHIQKNSRILTLSQTSSEFYVSAVQVFWKHGGKRRNCSWRANSPFPTVFSTCLKNFLLFSVIFKNSRLLSLWVSTSLKFAVWERVKEESVLGSTPLATLFLILYHTIPTSHHFKDRVS